MTGLRESSDVSRPIVRQRVRAAHSAREGAGRGSWCADLPSQDGAHARLRDAMARWTWASFVVCRADGDRFLVGDWSRTRSSVVGARCLRGFLRNPRLLVHTLVYSIGTGLYVAPRLDQASHLRDSRLRVLDVRALDDLSLLRTFVSTPRYRAVLLYLVDAPLAYQGTLDPLTP